MSESCSVTEKVQARTKKNRCPNNGHECTEVTPKTISHHLRGAWKWKEGKDVRYFFCDDPACEVVYFGDDDSVILKERLNTPVGVKEASNATLACYCFGVTKAEALSDPGIREYVLNQTKHAQCACDIRNPSGRCCLKDFPRPEKNN
jgi:hypothetical protein